jgi:hypothetical protein
VSLGNEHRVIVDAGWAYRANERGWMIYRDPATGLWHTRSQAIAIIEASGVASSTEDRGGVAG